MSKTPSGGGRRAWAGPSSPPWPSGPHPAGGLAEGEAHGATQEAAPALHQVSQLSRATRPSPPQRRPPRLASWRPRAVINTGAENRTGVKKAAAPSSAVLEERRAGTASSPAPAFSPPSRAPELVQRHKVELGSAAEAGGQCSAAEAGQGLTVQGGPVTCCLAEMALGGVSAGERVEASARGLRNCFHELGLRADGDRALAHSRCDRRPRGCVDLGAPRTPAPPSHGGASRKECALDAHLKRGGDGRGPGFLDP